MLKKIDFTKLPITEIVDEIIYTAAEAGSSDIHFDPTETDIKILKNEAEALGYQLVKIEKDRK